MTLILAVAGSAELAASLRSNFGFSGGVYVMIAELVVVALVTAVGLAWLSPRLKRSAIQRFGK